MKGRAGGKRGGSLEPIEWIGSVSFVMARELIERDDNTQSVQMRDREQQESSSPLIVRHAHNEPMPVWFNRN